jgi:hypothetical protein
VSEFSQISFRLPKEREIDEIGKALGLDEKQCTKLLLNVASLTLIMAMFKRMEKQGEEEGKPRSYTIEKLRCIVKHLRAVRDELVTTSPQLITLLRIAYGDSTYVADHNATALLLGKPLPMRMLTGLTEKEHLYNAKTWRLSEDTWTSLCKLTGCDPGEESADLPVVMAIDTLLHPLEILLVLEQHYKGGARGNPYRNAYIWELTFLYEKLFCVSPTPTPGGRFVLFCDLILNAVGIGTDGLEKAVERVLQQRKSNSKPLPETTPE